MADYDPLMYAPHAPGAPPPPINLKQQIQINRDCVFNILKGNYSKWMGPQYNYNDFYDKNGINKKIDDWIINLKQGDNLEQFKQMLNEFKESPRPTGHEPEKWYPFFVSWCQKFNRYISYFDFTSLIEKWYPTNSPTMSGPQGANLVIQLIECIINLTSSVISLEQEDRRRGGKKRKIRQTKRRKRQNKKRRRQTYKN
jgi:hypothetical protein